MISRLHHFLWSLDEGAGLGTYCFNCRAGSCKRHDRASAESPETEARNDLTLDAINIVAKLPAELKLMVAERLDARTLLVLRHVDFPSGSPWPASHDGEQLIRTLYHWFAIENAVFPQVAPRNTTAVPGGHLHGNGKISHSQHLLFLEVVHDVTTSVMDFLAQFLNLDRAHILTLRPAFTYLWRIVLVPVTAMHDCRVRKQEIFTYFHSLSQSARQDVLDLLQTVGDAYASKYPIRPPPLERMGKDCDRVLRRCHAVFALNWLRFGMTNLWKQINMVDVSLDARRAFDRGELFQEGWTRDREDQHARGTHWIEFECWSYTIMLNRGKAKLLSPLNMETDIYSLLVLASRRADEDGPLNWRRRDRSGVVSWMIFYEEPLDAEEELVADNGISEGLSINEYFANE